jgi:hypothetical protein
VRSRETSQNGLLTACFRRSEVCRFDARSAVPGTENTAMNGDQRAPLDATFDLARRNPGSDQLRPGDDSMGTPCDPSDLCLDCAAFGPYTVP